MTATSTTTNTHRLSIAWASYSRRSRMFARDLDATLYCLHTTHFCSKPCAPFRYALLAVRTLRLLLRVRPQAVHVQNPPCFCGLMVAFYCWRTGARYVLDHHSATFLRIWKLVGPVQRLVVRRAATNIVTSEHWADTVRSWGGEVLVMRDAFRELPPGDPVALEPGFHVVFVGTFAFDEPLDAVLGAAAELPDVHFHVTGDTRHARPDTLAAAPPNVTFTGFRPYGEYLGLLRGADAVMALTTRDHTLQGAGCEAVTVGTPLITSDWPYLREVFEGAVFVAPTVESIRAGVVEVIRRHGELSQAVIELRQTRRQQWCSQLEKLERTLTAPEPAAPVSATGLREGTT
jgi:glycosyltransferase involved in cell wall biosynthesis